MEVCRNCGTEIQPGIEFCTCCGVRTGNPYGKGYKGYEKNFIRTLPAEFRPMRSWGYFGFSLLFMIPIVGLILMIVLAACAPNVNLRRFSRFFLLFTLFILLMSILTGVVLNALFGDMVTAVVSMM